MDSSTEKAWEARSTFDRLMLSELWFLTKPTTQLANVVNPAENTYTVNNSCCLVIKAERCKYIPSWWSFKFERRICLLWPLKWNILFNWHYKDYSSINSFCQYLDRTSDGNIFNWNRIFYVIGIFLPHQSTWQILSLRTVFCNVLTFSGGMCNPLTWWAGFW